MSVAWYMSSVGAMSMTASRVTASGWSTASRWGHPPAPVVAAHRVALVPSAHISSAMSPAIVRLE